MTNHAATQVTIQVKQAERDLLKLNDTLELSYATKPRTVYIHVCEYIEEQALESELVNAQMLINDCNTLRAAGVIRGLE